MKKIKIKSAVPTLLALTAAALLLTYLVGNLKKADGVQQADATVSAATCAVNDVSVFLLTGIDNVGYNSDAIMLVSVSKSLGRVGVVQIPRDSYVNIIGKSYHKINAVYSEACRIAENQGMSGDQIYESGNLALCRFIEEVFGVRIDGYASVTTSGLSRIVDSFGGVDVNVPIDLSYDDDSQNLHIRLKAGENHLNGDLAVKFVRCRRYVNADYGRMSAQRIFMGAMVKKIKEGFNVSTALNAVKTVLSNVNTDIELSRALPLARAAMGIDSENVNMVNLAGNGVKIGGVYCEVLNAPYCQRLIAEHLYFGKGDYGRSDFDPNGILNDRNSPEIDRLYSSDKLFK